MAVKPASFPGIAAPSWHELEEMVMRKGAQLGDLSLTQEDYFETGPPNPYALKRTFGKNESVRVKLYRDSAGWCPFSQRIWIQLEEKRIPYTVELINLKSYGKKPDSYFKISPQGLIPALELDGQVLLDSAIISEALEEEFRENPLIPPEGTDSMRKFQELTETLFVPWKEWMNVPEGHDIKEKRKHVEQMDWLESILASSESPYFLDEGFSMADVNVITRLARFLPRILYLKGFRVRGNERYPLLTNWFDLMEQRPTYAATILDYYTSVRIMKRLCPDRAPIYKSAEHYTDKIDGRTGWALPLEPLSSTSLEPYAPGDNPPLDAYQAGKRLVMNHIAVVKFALRGSTAHVDGNQTSYCALSDSLVDVQTAQQTDAALWMIAQSLLLGVDEVKTPLKDTADGNCVEETVKSLEFLRDHVGVPRDLDLPAARQFRAHINWMLDQLV